MTNFVQSLFEGLRDRINNPIAPAFVVAWVVMNWGRLFVLFTSGKTAEDRLKQFTFTEWLPGIWATLAGPFLIAATYVVLMPWVICGIQWIQEEPLRRQRKSKTAFESELADDELALEKKRHEIAKLKGAALFEERVVELEKRVKELSVRNTETPNPGTENGTSSVRDDDDEERQERESVRRRLSMIGCSAPMADKLYEFGITDLDDLADADPVTLRDTIPTIDLFINKARFRSGKKPLPKASDPRRNEAGAV